MNITVYQQVFVQGDRTRTHVTITAESGEVIDRRFTDYQAFPLGKIAGEHMRSILRVLKRSLAPEKVTYDCNVLGRIEFTPTKGGFERKLVKHPRIGDAEMVRLQWTEPAPKEDEEESEE